MAKEEVDGKKNRGQEERGRGILREGMKNESWPSPQKLWDNKCVLFLVAHFVVVCYSAIDH